MAKRRKRKASFARTQRNVQRRMVDPEVDFIKRAAMIGGVGGALWLGLIGRFYQLQVLEGDVYSELAKENRVRLDLAPPKRGLIVDRFGQALASHRSAGRVSIVREQAGDMQAVLSEIGKLIDLPAERQARILRDASRQASFLPTLVARELTYEDFARMKLYAAELPGVDVAMGLTRSYPRGRDFAHVLGYVAKASQRDLVRLTEDMGEIEARNARRLYRHPDMRTGRSGIELVCDDWLTGDPGSREVVTNASGRILEELGYKPEPQQGKDVVITIDAELQRFAIERFGDESGAAVVMDVETGAILAFVSTPAFDPNDFVNGISQTDYDVLRGNDRAPLYHKAYDGVYPPGSTFKMVVATAALETEIIDPRERIYCNGRHRFGNRTWSCWKPEGHGAMDMRNAIKQSCDTYFYEIAERIGIEKLAETAKKFGFGMSWALGMTGGAVGVVPNDEWKQEARGEPWFEGETLNIGIGQGYMSATPLQLAVMTARIARGGGVLAPKLVHEGPDTSPGDDKRFTDTQQPLNPDHMKRIQDAMFAVTGEWGGTARRSGDLGLGGVFMAGKTGTAQVRYISQAERARGVIANENLERKLRDHALFVGYAPHDNPQYAVSVIVEHGGGGSAAAAPVARDILAAAIRRDSRRTPTGNQVSSTDSSSEKGAL
ncbi:MAG: penicillin-binding protein 2 [Pseudomonadota bacterium]